ncbi:hypothetical protein MVES1_002320 [Malassezia vespertilionis]|uniref:Transcription factor IIIC putative zinc-finger domain-containing protein n=1 Tax=Malassezia vespertilionis TaxID=2020962 RepID=A0A2N1JBD7_9BASI|nr:uncharacterized protein MVES1_002320 [Malassezia vespertilionis]PKI83870.1 hypothetical protein MVES_002186 [Malassezia vespertilionis]WFD06965.1 hypothetical protein MVES1_002320 [Malassezia vespertilionis]
MHSAAWTTAFTSGSAVAPAQCIQWSEEGQLLVATTDALHILTPRIGLFPERNGTLDHAVYSLHAHTSTAAHPRYEPSLDEDRATLALPYEATEAWRAAKWSPAGFGPHGACVLATIDARQRLAVYAAEQDTVRGPWTCVETVKDFPYAAQRTDDARRLASSFLALDCSSCIHGEMLLAAGTRGGDLVVWSKRGTAPLNFVTSLRFDAPVDAVQWDAAREIAVHAGATLYVVRMAHSTADIVQLWPLAPRPSLVAWDRAVLHAATPMRLHTFTEPSAVALPMRYVAGQLGKDVVLDDGTVCAWDNTHHKPSFAPALCGIAPWQATPLLAVLRRETERATWRYAVTRRTEYTLYMPLVHGWDINDDAAASVFWDLVPSSLASPPLLAWRAVLLACALCGSPAALSEALCARLHTEYLVPLAARLERCWEARAPMDAWRSLVHDAQSLRWLVDWIDAQPYMQGKRSLCSVHAWSDVIAAVVAALAAPADDAAFKERLGARLMLLAQASDERTRTILEQVAKRTTSRTQWAEPIALGETCPACDAPLAFQLARYTQCAAGHVFERCVATHAVIDTTDTLSCVGCGRNALRAALDAMPGPFPAVDACAQCGNRYRAPR